MSTAAVAARPLKADRKTTVCLILAALLLLGGIAAYISGGDAGAQISALNARIKTLTAENETLSTMQTRLDKRAAQLADAKDALAASPDDEKLLSKRDRAQSEYDKALKNRDKQLTLMADMGDIDALTLEAAEITEGVSGKRLTGNLLFALCVVSGAAALAFAGRAMNLKMILSLALLLAGALIASLGMYQNGMSPAATPGEPGAPLICAGVGVVTIAHILYCAFLTRAKLDMKLLLGAALTLTAGGLCVTAIAKNSAPDAASQFINAMSPGFLFAFGGVIAYILGAMVMVLPFHKVRYDLRKNPMLVLMVLPSVLYFLVTSYLPMVGIYFAFTNYQFTTNFFATLFGSEYVGLNNFKYLFSSGIAWKMTFNTVVYNLIFIVVGTFVKVAVAIMFSEIMGKKYKKLVQTITFLPHFISMVMIGTFAYSLLNYNTGIINSLIVKLGGSRVDFYSIPWAWYIIIPLVNFWKEVGYGSIIYVSAITGISDELYEAADLDGASFMQEIRYITIPCIRPTIVILVLMSLGNIMRGSFDLFYQLVGRAGKLFEATEIIDTYVWRALRDNVQIGMGSSAGLYQSLVGMALVVTVNAIVKKIEPDYSIF